MTTSSGSSGCDLLHLIGLDMQYARWRPSNQNRQSSDTNQKHYQQHQNNQRNFQHQNLGGNNQKGYQQNQSSGNNNQKGYQHQNNPGNNYQKGYQHQNNNQKGFQHQTQSPGNNQKNYQQQNPGGNNQKSYQHQTQSPGSNQNSFQLQTKSPPKNNQKNFQNQNPANNQKSYHNQSPANNQKNYQHQKLESNQKNDQYQNPKNADQQFQGANYQLNHQANNQSDYNLRYQSLHNGRRREVSPWTQQMGDDSGLERSVSSTSSISSLGGGGRGEGGGEGHQTLIHPPTNIREFDSCNQQKQFQRHYNNNHHHYNQHPPYHHHYNNQQAYRRNEYNTYQNSGFHHQYNQGGGGNGRRGRYHIGANHMYPPNMAANSDTNYNSNNGAQKRNQQNGRQQMATTVRRPGDLFSLMNKYCSPRFIKLINAVTPPDKFLPNTNSVQITKPPPQLTNGSVWDELSKAVWNKFLTNQQTKETYEKKLTLWKSLYVYLKTVYPRYSLFMVGSTMSGFGSNTSDMDMCLIVKQSEMEQRTEALYHLSHVMNLFNEFVSDFFTNIELIHAKVPILKFKSVTDELDVDLSCNNTVGVRNTHLLYCYANYDWRVRPLVVLVKLWAQWHDINSARNTTLSSYSLALMVIHFLQTRQPAVLPVLQRTNASLFAAHIDPSHIDFHAQLVRSASSTATGAAADNQQPIGQLLVDLFNYYQHFDYRRYAISVRQGCCVPIEECRKVRTSKNEPHHWKYLCIEEPFDLTNTARSVNNPESFDKIRNVIHQTSLALNATGALDSIFRLDLGNGWIHPHTTNR